MPEGKILLKEERQVVVSYWNPPNIDWKKRPIVRTLSAAILLAPIAWLLSNFFQLRGYVNLPASRIDLGIAVILLLLFVGFVSSNLPKWRWRTGILGFTLIFGMAITLDVATLPRSVAAVAPATPEAQAEQEAFMGLAGHVEYGDDLNDTIITFTNNSRFGIGKHQLSCLIYTISFVGGGGIDYKIIPNAPATPGTFQSPRPSGERIGPGGDASTASCIDSTMKIPPVRCADIGAQMTYVLEDYPTVVKTKQFRFVSTRLGTKVVWAPQPVNYKDNNCVLLAPDSLQKAISSKPTTQ